MDIRGMVLVEIKRDARSYFFYMPVGAPYIDASEAALMISKDIKVLHEKAVAQQEERDKEEESKEEESKEEENSEDKEDNKEK